MYALLILFSLAWMLIPIIALVVAIRAKSETRELRERIRSLEAGLAATPAPTAPPVPTATPTPALAVLPIADAPAPAIPPIVDAPAPAQAPTALPPIAAATIPPRKRLDSEGLEQLIGGIWLQNVGSVLLLLGTFFLILWGYTQGKIGPEVLIVAGVALGVALAWRGDRIARTLRPLGHALLGVGLGVVYITLYLGHFRMGVLSGWVAFTLLSLLSFLTVDIGLRRQQAVIASLGVAGAFIPLLMTSMSGEGFDLTPPAMLGYFAVVNAVVFALTAAKGWSGLVLMALFLTTATWTANMGGAAWGFPIQLGLCGLYTALGMAPVVRLVRISTPVRGIDLAVVAMAPMFLLVGTLSYFTARKGVTTGGLLAALALVNLIVALWVDARRSERDLWRPLTAAATVFLAASLERLLANEYLSLAWCVEGVALVWLGTAPRGGWIRGLGYGISFLAFLRLVFTPGSFDPAAGDGIGVFNGTALRDLLCIAAMVAVSDRIGRRRASLSEIDRHAPGIWLAATNALLMIWLYRESPYVASRAWAVGTALIVALAWIAQSASLVFLASARGAPILRHVGYAVGLIGFIPFLVTVAGRPYWKDGDWPVLYPAGVLTLLCVAVALATATFLWSRRATFGGSERRAPEIATAAANVALLLWTAREAGHVASAIAPGAVLLTPEGRSTAMLAAGITSGAWILQAGALLALGWTRGSAFLRWMGLGLVGLTLTKFILVDLQRVDVFWRFVIALGVGAVLLVFSFIYQRRNRREGAEG